MGLYFIPKSLSSNSQLGFAIYVLVVALLLFIVRSDCKQLGESFVRHILLVAFFPVLFGILWLFLWPGTLRLRMNGKSLSETHAAKALRRHEARKRRSNKVK